MEDEFGQPFDKKTFKRIQVFSSDAETEEFDMDRKEQ
jgi:hypothetical protein